MSIRPAAIPTVVTLHPNLGFNYVLLHGRSKVTLGAFVVDIQHDPDCRPDGTRAGPEWCVRVTKNDRSLLVATGTRQAVEQRFKEWEEFFVAKRNLRAKE